MKGPEELPLLTALGKDIRRLQDKVAPPPRSRPQGAALAMRVGLELVSGALVGGGSGYFLDRWLGTSPVLLIVCFFLGAAAGFLTIYRAAQEMEHMPAEPGESDAGDAEK